MIGTKLAHYEITAHLGSGGMGDVYQASDTKLNREVAIKVLPDVFAQDSGRMARFEREAKVLASLNHPNIAHIYGIEERALVMELAEGESPKGPMPFDDAWKIALQVADALEYAHEQGVVHRDLKPANIKITPDGVVKLLDFGLAKAFNDAPDTVGNDPSNSPTLTLGGTVAGAIVGTAAYMADKRADVWSWGVVLYELLTGEQMFQGEDAAETLAAVIHKQPNLERVPVKVRRLLGECLQKDPKLRLRDIGDAKRLLQESAPLVNAPSRLGTGIAAVMALSAALGLFAWWRASRPPLPAAPPMNINFDLGLDAALSGTNPVIISPDGARIAYISRGAGGITQLSVRQLDQPKATPLAGTEGARQPFFSPDGQWIGFDADGKLKKISVSGGAPLTLCDAPNMRGASWGDDDMIVVALESNGALSVVPAIGGVPKPLLPLAKGETRQREPQVLPGAKAVIFSSQAVATNWDDATVDAVTLSDHKRRTLVRGGYFGRYLPTGGRAGGHLVYMHLGTLFAAPFDPDRLEVTGPAAPLLEDIAANPGGGEAAFNFSRTGTFVYVPGKAASSQLVLAWLDGAGQAQTMTTVAANYSQPRVSPDGKRVALTGPNGIWVYDVERDHLSRITPPGEFSDSSPVWTPDAKRIAFRRSDNSGGAQGTWWIRADGSGEPQRLTHANYVQTPYSFSPDGKWLLFTEANPETNSDIWIVSIDQSDAENPKLGMPEPFIRTKFSENTPAFSPDGRWVAYTSNESGTTELFVRPFPSLGGRFPVSTGAHPVWSQNGRELFWQLPTGLGARKIMVAGYSIKGNTFVVERPRLWSDKGQAPDLSSRHFDLAPDSSRILVFLDPQREETGAGPTHVTFLLNFFDQLSGRVPTGGK
jgi:serine/threonine-protein kinase